jgi:ATP-dependent DNA helicase RecG
MTQVSRDDFAAQVAMGEDSFTEFKDPAVATDGLAKELCAFLNGSGGRVFIGVDDDGTIVGAGAWDEERVMNVVRSRIEPPPIPTFQKLRWGDETDVMVVSVEQGTEKPYAVATQQSRRYYIRVGTTSREASREELVRLTQASGSVAADLRPVLGSGPEDLDEEALNGRFASLRSLGFAELDVGARERVLRSADIVHRELGVLTVAGVLCYGKEPQRHLPHAHIMCVSYPNGVPSEMMLDRHKAAGRVEEQVDDAVRFVERNLWTGGRVEGTRRVDQPRPSVESLREVMANAVGHRHYGIDGPVLVRVFSDRIEAQSPGSPPNGVDREAMRLGVTVRRNELVMQHLARLGTVDLVGRGLPALFDEAAGLGVREPDILTSPNLTRVTLFLTA